MGSFLQRPIESSRNTIMAIGLPVHTGLFRTNSYSRSVRSKLIVKVSQGEGDQSQKPTIGIDCGLHSCEWISPAVCRIFIKEYLRCTKENEENCSLFVDNNFYDVNFLILPLVNQDGYYYTWENDRLWRKTRSPNKGKEVIRGHFVKNYIR